MQPWPFVGAILYFRKSSLKNVTESISVTHTRSSVKHNPNHTEGDDNKSDNPRNNNSSSTSYQYTNSSNNHYRSDYDDKSTRSTSACMKRCDLDYSVCKVNTIQNGKPDPSGFYASVYLTCQSTCETFHLN